MSCFKSQSLRLPQCSSLIAVDVQRYCSCVRVPLQPSRKHAMDRSLLLVLCSLIGAAEVIVTHCFATVLSDAVLLLPLGSSARRGTVIIHHVRDQPRQRGSGAAARIWGPLLPVSCSTEHPAGGTAQGLLACCGELQGSKCMFKCIYSALQSACSVIRRSLSRGEHLLSSA